MPSINRRRLLSSALAVPAGAGVVFSQSPAPDPIPALIAEENRIRWLAIAARETAETIWGAMPESARKKLPRALAGYLYRNDGRRVPLYAYTEKQVDELARATCRPAGAVRKARAEFAARRARLAAANGAVDYYEELFRETDRLDALAGALYDQIVAAKATTIAGAIAQIEFLNLEPTDAVDTVIASLRNIGRALGQAVAA